MVLPIPVLRLTMIFPPWRIKKVEGCEKCNYDKWLMHKQSTLSVVPGNERRWRTARAGDILEWGRQCGDCARSCCWSIVSSPRETARVGLKTLGIGSPLIFYFVFRSTFEK